MSSSDTTIIDYLNGISEERKTSFFTLRETIINNIPTGFEEQISYGMLGYVVPHKLYPDGYHCNPKLPLPFIAIASQKNFVALYHMGIYLNPSLLDWFTSEYPKHCSSKLDIGKSCIQFKKMDQIPFELISELIQKISLSAWIECYESKIKNRKS